MTQSLCDQCKNVTVETLKSHEGHKHDKWSLECSLYQLMKGRGDKTLWCKSWLDDLPPVLNGLPGIYREEFPVFVMT